MVVASRPVDRGRVPEHACIRRALAVAATVRCIPSTGRPRVRHACCWTYLQSAVSPIAESEIPCIFFPVHIAGTVVHPPRPASASRAGLGRGRLPQPCARSLRLMVRISLLQITQLDPRVARPHQGCTEHLLQWFETCRCARVAPSPAPSYDSRILA